MNVAEIHLHQPHEQAEIQTRYRLKSKEETMCLVKIVKITIRERKTYNY